MDTPTLIAADHPAITSWLAAKKSADAVALKLKVARKALEEVLPPGTVVPDDFPVYWQESKTMTVEDMSALPKALLCLRVDVDKIHAHAKLHDGQYPQGIGFEPSFALKARAKK